MGFWSKLLPTPIPDPYLVCFNPEAARLINMDPREVERPEFLDYFSGHKTLPGSDPLAMIYSGHQFGVYVPQLGDGRAILLGEVVNPENQRWDLHLKGAGQTPYSRHGDGRAVLRSSIREFLCGEAMEGLGIPTTRGLCVVGSDQTVYRETPETAAVLLRLAQSHIRFGSFELFYYRKETEHIQTLADYVLRHHFSDLLGRKDRYLGLLVEVIRRTAHLIAQWQAVGFVHGVMNTDNMSILGLTFDYGPFAFMDSYDSEFVSNHSDHEGRYAFNQQPGMAFWNLIRFAKSLTPLVSVEEAQEALDAYLPLFREQYEALMCRKLGLREKKRGDLSLINQFLQLMDKERVDYTLCFRALANFKQDSNPKDSPVRDFFIDRQGFDDWAEEYRLRLKSEERRDLERKVEMNRINPKYILRNYMAQVAITKATEERDYSEIELLLSLLKNPFEEQPSMKGYAERPPDWAQHIHLSCSS